jgi:acetyl esterase/lipase
MRYRVEVPTEAAAILNPQAVKPEQPFVLCQAWHAPHAPLESTEPLFSQTPAGQPKSMKTNRWIRGLGLLAAMLCWLPSGAAGAAPKGRAGEEGSGPPGKVFTYKQSAGQAREMEVYFPPNHDASKAKVPGLILFHGGSWSGGTLQQFRAACHYFATRGLVTATANYQMLGKKAAESLPPGETRKRVCVTDAKSAIRWFKEHAGELGVDPERIIAGGGSAGGHVSALATLNPGLNDPADPAGFDTGVVAYLWFNPAFSPEDHRDSEIDVLRSLRKEQAPSITFFGTNDTWLKGWEKVSEKLKDLGHSGSEQWFAEGQGHSFFNKEPWRTLTLLAADRFLVQRGLLQGEPTQAAPAGPERLFQRP